MQGTWTVRVEVALPINFGYTNEVGENLLFLLTILTVALITLNFRPSKFHYNQTLQLLEQRF